MNVILFNYGRDKCDYLDCIYRWVSDIQGKRDNFCVFGNLGFNEGRSLAILIEAAILLVRSIGIVTVGAGFRAAIHHALG